MFFCFKEWTVIVTSSLFVFEKLGMADSAGMRGWKGRLWNRYTTREKKRQVQIGTQILLIATMFVKQIKTTVSSNGTEYVVYMLL